MSGTNYYYGDNVNMHGGSGNTGMIKNQAPAPAAPASPELQAAVQELLDLLSELRPRIPAASAQALDDSVPGITADPAAPAQERHRALLAVAGIAATVGAVGQPIVEAVNRVLELLG
ncbi:hypothetical protein [Streptomyces sp. bgisy159]|uniref:hypothetical protein n=1 Tax=Streptomyces sp. bgisy159 TaxID=3413795 RepID=UPI003F49B49E